MARIKFNYDAFDAIRTSAPVLARLDQYAEQRASAAGEGYTAMPAKPAGQKRKRGRAAVVTTTAKAMRNEAKNHTLARG